MKQKRKLGRKLLSFLLTLVMVASFFGVISFPTITVNAAEEEVLLAEVTPWIYSDLSGTSIKTNNGVATVTFSSTPQYENGAGWKSGNADSLSVTVASASKSYTITKCVYTNVYDTSQEVSKAPFEYSVNNDAPLTSILIYGQATPTYTGLSDGMVFKFGETLIPLVNTYQTANYVILERPTFKVGYLYTLVRGNIEGGENEPEYFVKNDKGDYYAIEKPDSSYSFDKGWKVTNHSDGLLVSQGTSQNIENPEEQVTTYSFSVHEKEINNIKLDGNIENGSIVVKDSERTIISEAEAESTVTLEVSPDNGYKLDKISANYLEVQSVSQLMELIGNEKCYEYPSNTAESNYFEVVDNSIKVYSWMQGDFLYSLPSTVELNKTRSSEGIYTAIGTYNNDLLTWIFKVKNGKIISISFEKNGVDWGIVNIESTGAIAEPTYASVDLTTVTEGEKYTFTMPATDVIVNATFTVSSDSGSGSSSSDSSDNTNTSTDTSTTVPYNDVAISTGSVNDITGTAAATAESNPFGTKIENNDKLTTLLALTPEEVAQGVNVWLDIQDMSASVPQTDKDLVQNASTNYNVGMYLDINLFKKVGGNEATKITETNGTVKASILIPESLWKSGRTFEIIRVHDGVATAIEGTYDENTHVFTFETDKFSTYALTYKDSASLSDSGTTSDSGSSNSSNSTQSSTPKTGDPNDIRVWYLLLLASFGGLGFLGLSKKKETN